MNTKRIREGTKQRLEESWPQIMNGLFNPAGKEILRKALNSAGYDIENNAGENITISDPSDPRLKSGLTIFKFPNYWDKNKHSVCAYLDGKCVVDCVVPDTDDTFVSSMPWSWILSNSTEIYHADKDSLASTSRMQKRADRAASRKGIEKRYLTRYEKGVFNPNEKYPYLSDETGNSPGSDVKLDKSGFILNPNKYIDMLAAAGIKNGDKILQDAKDTYRKLANITTDHLDDEWDNEYIDTLNGLDDAARELKRALGEYNQTVEKYGEEAAYSFAARTAKVYLKRLRHFVKKAKELITKG